MDTKGTLNVSWALGYRSMVQPSNIQYIPPDNDPDDLHGHELRVAEMVAEAWKDTPQDKRRLVLWRICKEHDVDLHKVARHLAWRRSRQLYQRR